jgi:hypothetical protein
MYKYLFQEIGVFLDKLRFYGFKEGEVSRLDITSTYTVFYKLTIFEKISGNA